MAPSPITSWQIDGTTMEIVTDFIFLGSKIPADSNLQPWNEKTLAPWKKNYDKPGQRIEKQRHHFADKGPYSQSYGFYSSHYECERWIIEKVECWRIDAFELWCWRRHLRVPRTARRSNQSIPKKCPEYSLEGLMLRLKLQYFGHLLQRTNSLGKNWGWERLRVGGEWSNRRWDGWMSSLTQWTWVRANSGRSWSTGKPGVLQSMGLQRFRHNWATEQQQLPKRCPVLWKPG